MSMHVTDLPRPCFIRFTKANRPCEEGKVDPSVFYLVVALFTMENKVAIPTPEFVNQRDCPSAFIRLSIPEMVTLGAQWQRTTSLEWVDFK